ncbi:hypothetical protein D3C78_982010 [compost metagenome]
MIMPKDSIFRNFQPCPGFLAVIIAKAVDAPPKSMITKPYNEYPIWYKPIPSAPTNLARIIRLIKPSIFTIVIALALIADCNNK